MADKSEKQEKTTQSLEVVEESLPDIVRPTPMMIIADAVQNGDISIEVMERLYALQEQWEKREAAKSFNKSFSNFQYGIPEIKKTKYVKHNDYWYAPLPEIVSAIKESLHENGLSFRWDFEEGDGVINCECIMTHVDGHSVSSKMSAPADTSGNKSSIHSIASARQYLQRYTLIGVGGLSTAEDDNDGRSAPDPQPNGTTSQTSKKPAFDEEALWDMMERLFTNPGGIIEIKCGGKTRNQLTAPQKVKLLAFVKAYDGFQKGCKAAEKAGFGDMIQFYLDAHEIENAETARTDSLKNAGWSLFYRLKIDEHEQALPAEIYAALHNNILGPAKAKSLDDLSNDHLKALYNDLEKAVKE